MSERKSTNYNHDRPFTNYVHSKVAIPLIYNPLGWNEVSMSDEEKVRIDINDSIDYTMIDSEGNIKTIQERFRDNYYNTKYNDVTFRYRRDNNPHFDRRESEFYKIKAKYFLYGITNGSKFRYEQEVTGFSKYCLFFVQPLITKIETGDIIIKENIYKSYTQGGKLFIPHNFNKDGSSSFIAFDVPALEKLWPGEIIIQQKGFY